MFNDKVVEGLKVLITFDILPSTKLENPKKQIKYKKEMKIDIAEALSASNTVFDKNRPKVKVSSLLDYRDTLPVFFLGKIL